jgi:hypothetical protein
MFSIHRFARSPLDGLPRPTLDLLGLGFERSAAAAEHPIEGPQRPQQVRADESVVVGHGIVPGARLLHISACR